MGIDIGYYDDETGHIKVLQTEETYEQAKRVLHVVNEHEIVNNRPPKFGIVSWIKDSNYGPDQERYMILFDPYAAGDKEVAAFVFYHALCQLSRSLGQNPDTEVQYLEHSEGGNPRVVWESGPYEWGIVASGEFLFNRKAGWFTEPYYSFDVCFTE